MELNLLDVQNLEKNVKHYVDTQFEYPNPIIYCGIYLQEIRINFLKMYPYPYHVLSPQKFSYLFRISVNSLDVKFIRKSNGIFVTGIQYKLIEGGTNE